MNRRGKKEEEEKRILKTPKTYLGRHIVKKTKTEIILCLNYCKIC